MSPLSLQSGTPPHMGFQLTISEGKEAGRQFEFDQTSIVIGRTQDCDVILYEGGVSRRHARVFLENGTWYLVDEGSSNGTLVNGQSVKRHALQEGDAITIGPVVFVWRPVELEALPPEVPLGDEPPEGAHTRIVSTAELKRTRNRAVAMLPKGATRAEVEEMGRRGTQMQVPAYNPGARPVSGPRPSVPRPSAGPRLKLADSASELPEGVAVEGGGRPSLIRASGERPNLSAAERARFKREGVGGRLRLWWTEAGLATKSAVIIAATAVAAGVVAMVVLLTADEVKPRPKEPTTLTAEPVDYSFGLGPGVTFERADEKLFEFQVTSPVQVIAVLHYQSRDINLKDEVTVTVNGNEVGTLPLDGLDVEEATHEVILPASAITRTNVNTVVFDNTRNPPEHDTWRIWNLWLEIAVLPEKDPSGIALEAESRVQKGLQKWDQREIGASNRWEAYRSFREAWLMLETIAEPRPATYLVARDKMNEARVELDLKCRTLLLEARTAFNLKQYDAARFALDHVAEFFPSRAHPCPARADYERAVYEL